MIRQIGITILWMIVVYHVQAQHAAPVRYRDVVFSSVAIQKNISYQSHVTNTRKKRYSKLDFYQPIGDSFKLRPLIVWIHGGGFKFGSKKSAGTPLWSRQFAQRGYVCAAVNYRLSKKHPLANFKDMVAGCYDAVKDVMESIAYFKEYYKKFRIDTNCIILAGNSVGGMVALQAVYSSPYDLAKLAGLSDTTQAYQGYNAADIKAVVNCWGAIFDTTWLQNAKVPIVSIHGVRDRIVPFDQKAYPLYGSLAVHREADRLEIPNALKAYDGFGHELHKHFNPLWAGHGTKKRWRESGKFIAQFLYTQLFKKSQARGS